MAQLLIMGLSVVPIKKEIESHPHLWVATLRLCGGAASLAVICAVNPRFRKHWSVFRPQRAWIVSIPAALLGAYVAMVCWLGGFKYTTVTRASLLNQTSTFFTVLFAWLFLRERLTRLRVLALGLALLGAMTVIWAGQIDTSAPPKSP